MSSTTIRFEKVSKKYILQHERARSFQELVLKIFHRSPSHREEFWALRDVSFTIKQGETVGIVGANGAGKSSVLKLISRILEPTTGQLEVRGRVGGLLELGAGFHPDLTGRENINLNGSILGLSKSEIQRKLDEIVSFAELERFIDIPVKYYSSGMYVRLGFSIAVHSDPEILLVDEVLAVGDAAFQRKCLDQINSLRQAGVTIVFVSHNIATVRALCSRVLWLRKGELVADGEAEGVIARYLDYTWATENRRPAQGDESANRWGSGRIRIVEVQLLDKHGQITQQFRTGDPMVVQMRYQAAERVPHPVFGLAIHRKDGIHITGPNTRFAGLDIPYVEGSGTITYFVPFLPLLDGAYTISISAHNWEDTEMYDYHEQLYPFRVLSSGGEQYGIITMNGKWRHEKNGRSNFVQVSKGEGA